MYFLSFWIVYSWSTTSLNLLPFRFSAISCLEPWGIQTPLSPGCDNLRCYRDVETAAAEPESTMLRDGALVYRNVTDLVHAIENENIVIDLVRENVHLVRNS